jgi:ABC-type branched-subunit amino acid transport system ATPase component
MSGAAAAPALALIRVSGGYGEALVIRDIDLAIAQGEILAVLGKNGMGKSTLLKMIMGFLVVKGGVVHLFGEEVTGLAPHRLARRAITYTPQEQALFQDLTVEDNLRLGLRDERLYAPGIARIGALFPFVPERLGQRAGSLSGGEQKMLLIARALMARPKLMLVDEITEGLQPSLIERLAGALREERARSGTAILLIEQNVRFALSIADGYAVLKRGEIVDRGRVGEGDAERRINEHLSV